MRTVVDGKGCNTAPGAVGLEVHGDLVVAGMDVVARLRQLEELIAALSSKKCMCSKATITTAVEVNPETTAPEEQILVNLKTKGKQKQP